MKSTRVPLLRKKFDSQYTFDLQGYLSQTDFESTIQRFNHTVHQHPPPGNKMVWVGIAWLSWLAGALMTYLIWAMTAAPLVLLIFPISVMIGLIFCVWRYRSLRRKFEAAILEACNQVNATENIRGINYRLCNGMSGSDMPFGCHTNIHSYLPARSSYAIVIEFDNRYHIPPQSRYTKEFVSIPLCPAAHLAEYDISEKDPAFVHSTNNTCQDIPMYEEKPTVKTEQP